MWEASKGCVVALELVMYCSLFMEDALLVRSSFRFNATRIQQWAYLLLKLVAVGGLQFAG